MEMGMSEELLNIKGCPWCEQRPIITKHYKEEMWNLIHRCKIIGTISFDWCGSLERLIMPWNERKTTP